MAVELVDLRSKITAWTDAVLEAYARALGIDKSQAVRKILEEWADERIAMALELDGLDLLDTPARKRPYARPSMPKAVRVSVFKRDGGRCRYCEMALDPLGAWHVDHVIPVADGGSSEPDNLALACAPCNLGKSRRTPEQWKAA